MDLTSKGRSPRVEELTVHKQQVVSTLQTSEIYEKNHVGEEEESSRFYTHYPENSNRGTREPETRKTRSAEKERRGDNPLTEEGSPNDYHRRQ